MYTFIIALHFLYRNLGWRTRAQLLQLHGNDENVVSSIVDRKIQTGEYREHPDLPDDDAAVMYYVMLDLSTVNEDETEERTQVSTDMTAELGTEAINISCLCKKMITFATSTTRYPK